MTPEMEKLVLLAQTLLSFSFPPTEKINRKVAYNKQSRRQVRRRALFSYSISRYVWLVHAIAQCCQIFSSKCRLQSSVSSNSPSPQESISSDYVINRSTPINGSKSNLSAFKSKLHRVCSNTFQAAKRKYLNNFIGVCSSFAVLIFHFGKELSNKFMFHVSLLINTMAKRYQAYTEISKT